MEITKQPLAGGIEVTVTGRLDAYWADHLAAALEETVRAGAHRIVLNMAGVPYMSSVGIRVLLRFHKQLRRINGSFSVSSPSDPVRHVLELTGLESLLATAAHAAVAEPAAATCVLDRRGIALEVFEVAPGAWLSCRVAGQPELIDGGTFTAAHCRPMRFPASTLAVGLGAFGNGFADCEGRFGEFLAAGGAAAYLPTDGTNVPDYMVSGGALVPEVQVLYALACEGAFSHLVRFETAGRDPAPLADLVEACLDAAAADVAAIAMVAESAGLVGAALRRSPALAGADRFAHPAIRDWLSFTPERAYARSIALVAGVATRTEQRALAPLLRPLGAAPWPAGHFHATAFSYRPFPKGLIDLPAIVAGLFEGETLQGLLHLLADDRPIAGAGQSEFVRGACWVGPIDSIALE